MKTGLSIFKRDFWKIMLLTFIIVCLQYLPEIILRSMTIGMSYAGSAGSPEWIITASKIINPLVAFCAYLFYAVFFLSENKAFFFAGFKRYFWIPLIIVVSYALGGQLVTSFGMPSKVATAYLWIILAVAYIVIFLYTVMLSALSRKIKFKEAFSLFWQKEKVLYLKYLLLLICAGAVIGSARMLSGITEESALFVSALLSWILEIFFAFAAYYILAGFTAKQK